VRELCGGRYQTCGFGGEWIAIDFSETNYIAKRRFLALGDLTNGLNAQPTHHHIKKTRTKARGGFTGSEPGSFD